MANTDLPGFLKRDGKSILFNGEGEFVFYVPEKFFETKNAVVIGEYVKLIGILDYAIFDKNGKHSGLKQFRLPTEFITRPYTVENLKDVQLTSYSKPTDYRAMKYKKDDIIIFDENVAQDVVNVESFYRLFIWGNLPNTIPYDELQNYFMENMALNGFSYGVSMQMIGIVLSEDCRYREDHSIPFRLAKTKNMHDYDQVNVREVARYTSPFASITGENWDTAVVNAVITDKRKYSPMEKIMMT
ncbi:MAG: hypothetical protein J6Y02_10180 [Pseudobutyrivibrio sp.]|nr:hypothetical protein [Pseudobutyrivibrio sp.]